MNRAIRIAILACMLGAWPVQAQTSQGNVSAAVPSSIVAPPVPASTSPAPLPCELHVFPAKNMIAINNLAGAGYLFGGGLVGATVGSAIHGKKQSSADVLRAELPPEAQISAVKGLSALNIMTRMADPVIIAEPALDDEEIPERSQHRLTNSTAPCYAELAIWSVLFDAVGGAKLHVVTYFREFNRDSGRISIHNEMQFGKLHAFPPKSDVEYTEAHNDLISTFSAVIEKSLRIMTGT